MPLLGTPEESNSKTFVLAQRRFADFDTAVLAQAHHIDGSGIFR